MARVREARLQCNLRHAPSSFEQAHPRALYAPLEDKTMHRQTNGLFE